MVYACRICNAFVASCATVHQASMKQNGRPTLNGGGMHDHLYILLLVISGACVVDQIFKSNVLP